MDVKKEICTVAILISSPENMLHFLSRKSRVWIRDQLTPVPERNSSGSKTMIDM